MNSLSQESEYKAQRMEQPLLPGDTQRAALWRGVIMLGSEGREDLARARKYFREEGHT